MTYLIFVLSRETSARRATGVCPACRHIQHSRIVRQMLMLNQKKCVGVFFPSTLRPVLGLSEHKDLRRCRTWRVQIRMVGWSKIFILEEELEQVNEIDQPNPSQR